MKVRVKVTEEPSQQILATGLLGLSEMEVAEMSSISTIRRDLRRQRQAAGNPLPIPLSRQDIELPDFYTGGTLQFVDVTHDTETFEKYEVV